MAGPYWTFFDFVSERGVNVIAEWLTDLPKSVWAALDNRLDYLAGERVPSRPAMAKLEGEYAELYEVRLKVNRVQYRPIAYRGASPRGQYTMLVGAREVGGKLIPRESYRTAFNRIADIEHGRGHVVEHERYDPSQEDRKSATE